MPQSNVCSLSQLSRGISFALYSHLPSVAFRQPEPILPVPPCSPSAAAFTSLSNLLLLDLHSPSSFPQPLASLPEPVQPTQPLPTLSRETYPAQQLFPKLSPVLPPVQPSPLTKSSSGPSTRLLLVSLQSEENCSTQQLSSRNLPLLPQLPGDSTTPSSHPSLSSRTQAKPTLFTYSEKKKKLRLPIKLPPYYFPPLGPANPLAQAPSTPHCRNSLPEHPPTRAHLVLPFFSPPSERPLPSLCPSLFSPQPTLKSLFFSTRAVYSFQSTRLNSSAVQSPFSYLKSFLPCTAR